MTTKTLPNSQNVETSRKQTSKGRVAKFFSMIVPSPLKAMFWRLDKSFNGSISFFFKHYGKSRFMVAMSKKIQYLGIERVYNMDIKSFWLFFFLYLVRDLILYIAIPIYIARLFLS